MTPAHARRSQKTAASVGAANQSARGGLLMTRATLLLTVPIGFLGLVLTLPDARAPAADAAPGPAKPTAAHRALGGAAGRRRLRRPRGGHELVGGPSGGVAVASEGTSVRRQRGVQAGPRHPAVAGPQARPPRAGQGARSWQRTAGSMRRRSCSSAGRATMMARRVGRQCTGPRAGPSMPRPPATPAATFSI